MIVTIDGPAGAGKSSVARALAERLGFELLDTGAMYRAVTLAALRRDVDLEDTRALAALASEVDLDLDGDRVLLDREDVSEAIRTPAVARAIHHIADNVQVRERMVELQRQIARGRDIVCEGRDQGTVAFPDAECKIFLVASAEERARRRQAELRQRGEDISFNEVLAEQNERDRRDTSRPVGALKKADDAYEVCTDGLTLEQVVSRLEEIVRGCRSTRDQ